LVCYQNASVFGNVSSYKHPTRQSSTSTSLVRYLHKILGITLSSCSRAGPPLETVKIESRKTYACLSWWCPIPIWGGCRCLPSCGCNHLQRPFSSTANKLSCQNDNTFLMDRHSPNRVGLMHALSSSRFFF
jgi:hypothetical protein